jgi:GNAT superfamily N-acetyltransferase
MKLIRAGQPQDYPLVLQALVQAFGAENPGIQAFDELYPDILRPDAECLSGFRFVEIDGALAAGIQIVPQTLVVAGEVTLQTGGIGQVFCLPAYRGAGLMSSLLKAVIEEMESRGYHLSRLNGDRRRYRNYGWERAGFSRRLWLSARPYEGSPSVPAADFASNHPPLRWTGDAETARRIGEAQALQPYREVRTAKLFPAVLRRAGVQVWTLQDDRGFAYGALNNGNLVEYGGHPQTFESLLIGHLVKGGLRVELPSSERAGPLEAVLERYAEDYDTAPTGQVRVFSLLTLLQPYAPIIRRRSVGASWDVVFHLQESGERVRLQGSTLSPAGSVANLPELVLPRAAWARVLFGPFAPEGLSPEWANHELFRLFPLPLFWPRLSHV